MDGNFKPKSKVLNKDLRLLELEENDQMNEVDELDFNLFDSPKERHRKSGRLHKCPRCKAVTRLETRDPYCPECNWDSLTDLSIGTNK